MQKRHLVKQEIFNTTILQWFFPARLTKPDSSCFVRLVCLTPRSLSLFFPSRLFYVFLTLFPVLFPLSKFTLLPLHPGPLNCFSVESLCPISILKFTLLHFWDLQCYFLFGFWMVFHEDFSVVFFYWHLLCWFLENF